MSMPTAALSGTFLLGGDLPVHRLGFGAMRITGDGVWGPPANRPEAIATLRRAIELEVTLIDPIIELHGRNRRSLGVSFE